MKENRSAVTAKTPFGRLMAGLIVGEVGMWIALLIPVTLLLALKMMSLNPATATASFSTIIGIGAIFALFGNPIGGAISDRTILRFGRRRTWIMLGSVIGSLALVGIGFSNSYIIVLILWCLTQTAYNFVFAAFTALIPDQVEEGRRGTMSGIVGLVMPVSPILGLGLMTVLTNASTPLKWSVLAVISVLTATVSCMLIKEEKVAFSAKQHEQMPLVKRFSVIYPSPRKYPWFTWGWFTRFFISLAYNAYLYNSIMLMKRYHYSQALTTSYTTLLTLVGLLFLALFSIFAGMLSDKLRKQKPFVVLSAAIIVIGLVIDAFAPSLVWLIVGNAFTGGGYGIFISVDLALVSRILPHQKDAAKDFGIMNIANTVPQSVVPFVAPLLLAAGGWPFFFCSLGVSGMLSAVCVIPIPEMSPKEVPESTAQ